jgi:hypothetical protein
VTLPRSRRLLTASVALLLVLAAGPLLTARLAALSTHHDDLHTARLLDRTVDVTVHHRTRERSHPTTGMRTPAGALPGNLDTSLLNPPGPGVGDHQPRGHGFVPADEPTSRGPPS